MKALSLFLALVIANRQEYAVFSITEGILNYSYILGWANVALLLLPTLDIYKLNGQATNIFRQEPVLQTRSENSFAVNLQQHHPQIKGL